MVTKIHLLLALERVEGDAADAVAAKEPPDVVKVRRHEGDGAVRAGLEEHAEGGGEQRLSVDSACPLAELVDEEEGARSGSAHRQRHLVHVHHEGGQAQRHRLDGLDAGANLNIGGRRIVLNCELISPFLN